MLVNIGTKNDVTNQIFIEYNNWYVPVFLFAGRVGLSDDSLREALRKYFEEGLWEAIRDIRILSNSRVALISALIDANILLFDPYSQTFREEFDNYFMGELANHNFDGDYVLKKIRNFIVKYLGNPQLKSWPDIYGLHYRRDKDLIIKGRKVLFSGIDFPHNLKKDIVRELKDDFTDEDLVSFCKSKILGSVDRYFKIYDTEQYDYEKFSVKRYFAIKGEIFAILTEFVDKVNGVTTYKTVFHPELVIEDPADSEEIRRILRLIEITNIKNRDFGVFSSLWITGVFSLKTMMMYILSGLKVFPIRVKKAKVIGSVIEAETEFGTITFVEEIN